MKKTVLVTGGARGIGRAIAEDFARDHNVVIVWRANAPDIAAENIYAIQSDLTEEESCKSVIAEVINRFGRLDVIVNNAGVVHSTPKECFDAATARSILDVNLLVPVAILAAALPHLKAGAAIVNISSVNAVFPPQDAVIYGASKAALNLWTCGMAKELGPKGIRVNAVAPGAINIPEEPRSADLIKLFVQETALGRIGLPDDISKAVRFLSSEQSGFITGEVITVSGGYRL